MSQDTADSETNLPCGVDAAATANAARGSMRLEIDPVVLRAETIANYVATDLPTHPGLARIAECVVESARQAKRVSRELKRPIGMHRLPLAFLILAMGIFAYWTYRQFFYTPSLLLAVPERDAIQLRDDSLQKTKLKPIETVGSHASLELLKKRQADLAFIQGGIDIPDTWLRMELNDSELVLLFLRDGIENVTQINKIFTSAEGQGSHSLAQVFSRVWGIDQQISYLHDWRIFTDDETYQIADDVDAVFVVKDLLNRKLESVPARLAEAGFRLASPDIGAMQLRLDYIREYELRPGYLDPAKTLPDRSIATYAVVTYLVAREGLSVKQLNDAYQLVHPDRRFPTLIETDLSTASEIAQGVEALFSILVYIGLTFFALLGIDVLAYRKRFHELNSLVSLISMHQSSKDVIVGSEALKAHHVTYLSVCSDLLSIISVVTGYYTQENSSLMYNRLSDVIHERCDGLKINIQLKILHATVKLANDTIEEPQDK